MQHCIESWEFLDAIITLCPKCHRPVKIVDMSDERTDQSMRTTLLSDSSNVCSDIVILGLVLSLVFTQKGRTTDFNASSMYTGLIRCPYITTRSVVLGFNHPYLTRDLANVNV